MKKIWHNEAWEDYLYCRIVFRIIGEELEILQCGSHYRDK